MAKQTTYEPVYSNNDVLRAAIEKKDLPKSFKTINSIHKYLEGFKKENHITGELDVTCSWVEKDTKLPEGHFNPANLGFREFTLDAAQGGMSYSRFPLHEF